MNTAIKWIDTFNTVIGKVLSFTVYLLLIIVLYEIVSRKIFGNPTIWGFELSYMLYGFLFMMGYAYALKSKSHVNIDIFYSRASPRKQGILDIIGYLVFFFPFIYFGLKASYQFTIQSWQIMEHSQSTWAPPVYPYKTTLLIGFFLLLLQGISEFLKAIYKVKTGEMYES